MNGNGVPDLPTEDANGDGVVDVFDCRADGVACADCDGRFVNEDQTNSITGDMIQNAAVTTAKISTAGASDDQVITYDGTSVVWADVPSTPIDCGDCDDTFVNEGQANSITTNMIQDAAVTDAKIDSVSPSKISPQGSGSGLDADLLDGLDSTAIGQLNATQAWSGVNTFENPSNFFGGRLATINNQSGDALWAQTGSSNGAAVTGYAPGATGVGGRFAGNGVSGLPGFANGAGVVTGGTLYGLYSVAEATGYVGQAAGYFYLSSGEVVRVNHRSSGGTHYKIQGDGLVSTIMNTSAGRVALVSPESPQAWIEDYGSGWIADGVGHVELDPLFLECVTIDDDHPMKVFVQLTSPFPHVVYVRKLRTGFNVIASDGGKAEASFDYKVVATWRGQERFRFEAVDAP